MRRKILGSSDQGLQSDLAEALARLIRILARQAARDAVASTPAPITERAADDRLHDLGTIAGRLNVSTKMVRRLIDRGELGYHQVGRLKRVSDGQYLEYLSGVGGEFIVIVGY
jgi:excisionase family DNA binding protein